MAEARREEEEEELRELRDTVVLRNRNSATGIYFLKHWLYYLYMEDQAHPAG